MEALRSNLIVGHCSVVKRKLIQVSHWESDTRIMFLGSLIYQECIHYFGGGRAVRRVLLPSR